MKQCMPLLYLLLISTVQPIGIGSTDSNTWHKYKIYQGQESSLSIKNIYVEENRIFLDSSIQSERRTLRVFEHGVENIESIFLPDNAHSISFVKKDQVVYFVYAIFQSDLNGTKVTILSYDEDQHVWDLAKEIILEDFILAFDSRVSSDYLTLMDNQNRKFSLINLDTYQTTKYELDRPTDNYWNLLNNTMSYYFTNSSVVFTGNYFDSKNNVTIRLDEIPGIPDLSTTNSYIRLFDYHNQVNLLYEAQNETDRITFYSLNITDHSWNKILTLTNTLDFVNYRYRLFEDSLYLFNYNFANSTLQFYEVDMVTKNYSLYSDQSEFWPDDISRWGSPVIVLENYSNNLQEKYMYSSIKFDLAFPLIVHEPTSNNDKANFLLFPVPIMLLVVLLVYKSRMLKERQSELYSAVDLK